MNISPASLLSSAVTSQLHPSQFMSSDVFLTCGTASCPQLVLWFLTLPMMGVGRWGGGVIYIQPVTNQHLICQVVVQFITNTGAGCRLAARR